MLRYAPLGPKCSKKQMRLTMLIVEEREDERWLIQRALAQAGILPEVTLVHSADEVLDYISGKREFADRARFPLPRTLVLPATLQSMDPILLIRKLAPLSFIWHGKIALLSASEQHPTVLEAVKLGAIVFMRPLGLPELARVLHEIYVMTIQREKAA